MRLVNAHDRGLVTAAVVADRLAAINRSVHEKEPSVGPNAIVLWRHRKRGRYKGGGGQHFYAGSERLVQAGGVPSLGQGMDLSQVVNALWPIMEKTLEHMRLNPDDPAPDQSAEMDAALAALNWDPDETLR